LRSRNGPGRAKAPSDRPPPTWRAPRSSAFLHRRQQLLHADRLLQEIQRADPRRLHRGVDRGVARHHHHRHVELAVAAPFLEQRDAIGIGHPDVEQDHVGTPGLARRPRSRGVFRELDVMALVAQYFREQFADPDFVIHHQYFRHFPKPLLPQPALPAATRC
jgi:hypothetical protein